MPGVVARASAARIGVSFIGGSARSRSSRAGRLQQQVAGRDHAAADHDHVGLEDVGEARQATPSRLPISSKTPIAVASPASAASVTALPSTVSPAASIARRAPSPGSLSAAALPLAPERRAGGQRLDAAAAGAVALAGRAVGLDHGVAELGAGAGRAAVDLAVEDQAAADPGADRQHHRVVGAAGGAVEVLGQGGDVGVVVDEDGQADPLADQVADRQVVERQVDGRDGDPRARGRSSPGCRGRPPRRRAGLRAPRSTSRTSSSTSSSSVWPVEASRLSQSTSVPDRGRPTSIFVPPRSTPIVSPALTTSSAGVEAGDRGHRA